MTYFVYVKDKKGNYKHYKVPEGVYTYILQLELAVKYPKKSKLKEVYKERFD